MSVGWDVKWCPLSRISTSLARKRPFHWISMKSGFVRAARETSKFHKQSPFMNSRYCYMAEILPIRRKNLDNQSSIENAVFFIFPFISFHPADNIV